MLPDGTLLQQRYRIVRRLKCGGMGCVYEARDERLGHTLALKQLVLSEPAAQKAFEREAKMLAPLRHAILPNVSDHFHDPAGLFLVMEYIPGEDLGEQLETRKQPFPLGQVLHWADQLLDGLDYLHGEGIVHRDIKPQNVKLTPRGEVILLDFGIAKDTTTGSVMAATPGFAPLEQMQGTGTDGRSDLYALAATMYALLTASKLESSITRLVAESRRQPDPLRPLHVVNPQMPRPISNVVMKALALHADQRPASAAAMRKMLRDASPSDQPPPPPPPGKKAPGIPTVGLVGVLFVLLLVALLAGGGTLMGGFLNGDTTADTPTSPAVAEAEPTATSTPTNPLFPVTTEEWRGEMARRTTEMTREGNHYWRYVPGGTYTIGGWTDDDREDNDEQAEVELQPYWIGKYPITVQQYRQFIEAGGYDNQEYWTPNGWKWKEAYNEGEGRSQPFWWGEERYSSDNQPVIGVNWYEATAFMNWLNAQLAGTVPEGYAIQLPTEAEWETACAYDAEGQRHPYPWGEDEPTRNLAAFDDVDDGSDPYRAAEVGGRSGGAAACGAQDMVGSVWEVTTSSASGYPGASGKVVGDFKEDDYDVPWRGVSWWYSRPHVRCAARFRDFPYYGVDNLNFGFRVLLSPRVLPN
jgi:formylglycine-generating enzyme required for sulfatase activity